jgi:hypothetical protein
MKRLFRVLLIMIPALVVIALTLVYFFMGAAVRKGVEVFGPQLTQTEVRLEHVGLSPFSGGGSMRGLWVGNPEGFRTEKAFYMGEVSMRVAPTSLLGDRILIKRIYISEPEFTYERKLTTSNINEILKNIESATQREIVGEDGKEVRSVKFEITEVIIEGGKVGVGVGSNSVTVAMPRLELRDIGKRSGGITAEEATFEIMQAVMGSVTRSVASSPGGALNSLRRLIDGGE